MNYTKKYSLIASVCAGAMMMASCGGTEEVKTDEVIDTAVDAVTNVSKEEVYKVSTANSAIHWEGNMVGLYSHSGALKISEGELTVAGDKIVGGSFTIDMASMTPTDDNYKPEEGKTAEKLVGHLSSPDFFDVENHPNATGKITSIEGNEAKIELTIRGNTSTEALHINEVSVAGGTVKANGAITFNRQAYDVAFNHPAQEMVLSDDIELNIDIVANK